MSVDILKIKMVKVTDFVPDLYLNQVLNIEEVKKIYTDNHIQHLVKYGYLKCVKKNNLI